MPMDQDQIRTLSDEATEVLLNKPGTVSSNRGGWMMISTILIEAWDLYAIAFVLIFIKQESRPGNTPIIVFEIADGGIDDVVSELASKGVTIVTPVSHAPDGWSAEFKDPEGHILSMYQSANKPRKR